MINVRRYNEKDLRQLIRLYQQAFAEPPWNETWSDEDVEKDLRFALSQSQPIVLVAMDNETLVGTSWGYKLPLEKFPFLRGRVNPSCSYMDEMAVNAQIRQQGIGKMLGNAYFTEARQQKIPEIVLRTDERNNASMALFRSLGFNLLGVRDPQYNNRQYLSRLLS